MIAQKELNHMLRDARKKHKEIIEQHFIFNNPKRLWDSMKAITNMNTTRNPLITNDDSYKANELNDFYCRFETQDFTLEGNNPLESIPTSDPSSRLVVDPHKIQSLFKHTCTQKNDRPGRHLCFSLKDLCRRACTRMVPCFPAVCGFLHCP